MKDPSKLFDSELRSLLDSTTDDVFNVETYCLIHDWFVDKNEPVFAEFIQLMIDGNFRFRNVNKESSEADHREDPVDIIRLFGPCSHGGSRDVATLLLQAAKNEEHPSNLFVRYKNCPVYGRSINSTFLWREYTRPERKHLRETILPKVGIL